MDTLDILENHIGTELTEYYVNHWRDAPASHVGDLMEKLAPHFYDCELSELRN